MLYVLDCSFVASWLVQWLYWCQVSGLLKHCPPPVWSIIPLLYGEYRIYYCTCMKCCYHGNCWTLDRWGVNLNIIISFINFTCKLVVDRDLKKGKTWNYPPLQFSTFHSTSRKRGFILDRRVKLHSPDSDINPLHVGQI